MKYVIMMWVIGFVSLVLSAMSEWNSFNCAMAGFVIGMAVVMSAVELKDIK